MEITNDEIKQLNISEKEGTDICQWIRNNVQKSKLIEVKEFLGYFKNYFDVNQAKMIEHVYRGIKNSLKVEYANEETVSFVRWLIYLLSDKSEFDSTSDVQSDLLKMVGEKSFLVKFYNQTVETKDKIEKKGHYMLFDKVTLTFLGGNVMFYYILSSVVDITDRVHRNPKYKLCGTLDWEEAITAYVLSEFKTIEIGKLK